MITQNVTIYTTSSVWFERRSDLDSTLQFAVKLLKRSPISLSRRDSASLPLSSRMTENRRHCCIEMLQAKRYVHISYSKHPRIGTLISGFRLIMFLPIGYLLRKQPKSVLKLFLKLRQK